MGLPKIFAKKINNSDDAICVSHVCLSSLDGSIASSSSESDCQRRQYGFGCESDKRFVESCLQSADAVVISGATLRVAGSMWPTSNKPHWYVASNVMESVDDYGVGELVKCEDPVAFILASCRQRGFRRVLLLCGGRLASLFYKVRAVDELFMTIAPMVIGVSSRVSAFPSDPEGVSVSLEFQGMSEEQGHVFLCYYS